LRFILDFVTASDPFEVAFSWTTPSSCPFAIIELPFLLDIHNVLNYLNELLLPLPYDQEDDDLFRLFWHTPGRVPQGRATRVAARGLKVSPEAVS